MGFFSIFLPMLLTTPAANAVESCEVVPKQANACLTTVMCPIDTFMIGSANCTVSPNCTPVPELYYDHVRTAGGKIAGVNVLGVELGGANFEINCSITCCGDRAPAPTQTQTQSYTQTQTQSQSLTATSTQTEPATFTQTQPGTQTQTQPATFTQTQPATQTQTRTQPSTDVNTSTRTETTSKDSDEGQEAYQEAQRTMLENAARQELTIGAVDCLAAANNAIKDQEAAAAELEACSNKLGKGGKLHDAAAEAARRGGRASPEFSGIDESLLGNERSRKVFGEFEKNYKMPGEELVRRMLSSGASFEELREVLKSRFPESKVEELMAGARDMKFTLDAPKKGRGGGQGKAPGLRDQLRTKFEDQAAGAPASGSQYLKHRKSQNEIGPEDLKPISDPLFSPGDDRGLTLFDVVKYKYRQKWDMMIHYKKR